ncbi:DUF5668 domain-containing protein, partial [candidate division KSB1 bacterium]|nr:DUF5668 domain-containing protein [candidate division KSB1 bacterium]
MFHYTDRSRGLFWGTAIIIIGILFLLDEFRLLNIGDLWPLIIIAVGIHILFKAQYPKSNHRGADIRFGDHSLISDDPQIIESNTFGDVKVTIKSKDFRSGQIHTTFGDVKVDLTDLNI